MQILSTKNVQYKYRTKYQTVHALKGIDLSFEKSKVYAIVGSSGCGKTTLLSLLAGLDVPTEGEVLFNGKSTAALDRDDYRKDHVSVIYQNFNLFHHLTVLENAAYPLYMRKVSKTEANKTAEEKLFAMGFTKDMLKRFPNMLSGGEQQRVAIARALTSGSELILADEPTGNLDEENSIKIFGILADLAHKEDRCVVIVTHDLALAEKADTIIRLNSGKVVD
ncbi:MAG: ABC transporter ATP-binding protein [Clostridia bacterium]|nr:ABC transporter ATP-binding protein [Clostridia bacterium]